MNNNLKITEIIKKGNKINYKYELNGLWKIFLNSEKLMEVEYETNIEKVPDSLAIIPFLCNILPISWVFDLSIEILSLDKMFNDNILNIKKGYTQMYPEIAMNGKLFVKDIVLNNHEVSNAGTMFSGGVDAFNTLFKHIEEKPILFTIWGADISLEDQSGWQKVNGYCVKIAREYKLKYNSIKSNFRETINYGYIMKYLKKITDKEWWHDFQHGIAILGHMAPLAYIYKLKYVYIASSFTASQKGSYTCASDPTIDNYVKYGGCSVKHDGYEYSRQDKIHNICNYSERMQKKVKLRVCWQSLGGDNCCECEKCYRTIMGIIAEKKNPLDYGFNLSKEKYNKMVKKLPGIVKYNFTRYFPIQVSFNKNFSLKEIPKELIWFKTYKIKNKKPSILLFIEKSQDFIKRCYGKIFKR